VRPTVALSGTPSRGGARPPGGTEGSSRRRLRRASWLHGARRRAEDVGDVAVQDEDEARRAVIRRFPRPSGRGRPPRGGGVDVEAGPPLEARHAREARQDLDVPVPVPLEGEEVPGPPREGMDVRRRVENEVVGGFRRRTLSRFSVSPRAAAKAGSRVSDIWPKSCRCRRGARVISNGNREAYGQTATKCSWTKRIREPSAISWSIRSQMSTVP